MRAVGKHKGPLIVLSTFLCSTYIALKMPSQVREATHAGSWYTSDGERAVPLPRVIVAAKLMKRAGDKLRAELQRNLGKVTHLPELDFQPPVQDAKAIIAPSVSLEAAQVG